MLTGPLIAAVVLMASPGPSRPDTVQQPRDTVETRTTPPAPDSSAPGYYRYRGDTDRDARLALGTEYRVDADTLPHRRHAIEYSEWYYRRLQIHRWGSYVELPVFAGEYWLGNKLISQNEIPASWVKPAHGAVATVLGGLFTVNTVTGLWNLYDSRKDTDQRALVWSHSALMLASDAGFMVTGFLAGNARRTTADANHHKDAAVVSMGLATAGTLLMWIARGL
jgi:hypothetical protein